LFFWKLYRSAVPNRSTLRRKELVETEWGRDNSKVTKRRRAALEE